MSFFAELKRRNVVRVGLAYIVIGWLLAQVAEFAFENFGVENMPLVITAIALPVDELPVFAALFDEGPFQKYAMQERYQIARQARLLASGETRKEIEASVSTAGYVLSN